MEQLTLNIENKSIIPSLKRVLCTMEGVSIAKPAKRSSAASKCKKTELDLALEDVKAGRVSPVFQSVEEAFQYLGI